MTGKSRGKFDVFFRLLITGTNQAYPSPKSVKFTKSNLFPDRGSVYDYFFQKSGTWASWEDLINKTATIPSDAKVGRRPRDSVRCMHAWIIIVWMLYRLASSSFPPWTLSGRGFSLTHTSVMGSPFSLSDLQALGNRPSPTITSSNSPKTVLFQIPSTSPHVHQPARLRRSSCPSWTDAGRACLGRQWGRSQSCLSMI